MKKEELPEFDAVIERVLGGGRFEVKVILAEGKEMLRTAIMSGRMRKFYIKVVPGDMVKVSIPLAGEIVRITYRYPVNKAKVRD